jgi:glycyl-tRNA synthetase
VIEPSFGVERAVMAVLVSAYKEDQVEGEKRIYLDLPEHLAPIRYAVCPLARNKPELVKKAREIYDSLKKKHSNILWIDSGNIGKNYRKMDEIGVPEVITVDFETLEKDTVTVRSRNTTKQERIKIDKLTKGGASGLAA